MTSDIFFGKVIVSPSGGSCAYLEGEEGVEIMCSIIERERAEGKAEGKIESMRLVGRNLLKRGMPEEEICTLAECTKEFVEEARKS